VIASVACSRFFLPLQHFCVQDLVQQLRFKFMFKAVVCGTGSRFDFSVVEVRLGSSGVRFTFGVVWIVWVSAKSAPA